MTDLARYLCERHEYPLTLDDFKIRKLKLRRGDLVVLKTNLPLDRDTVQAFKHHARKLFAPARVAILTAGVKISAVRKKKIK